MNSDYRAVCCITWPNSEQSKDSVLHLAFHWGYEAITSGWSATLTLGFFRLVRDSGIGT